MLSLTVHIASHFLDITNKLQPYKQHVSQYEREQIKFKLSAVINTRCIQSHLIENLHRLRKPLIAVSYRLIEDIIDKNIEYTTDEIMNQFEHCATKCLLHSVN